MGWLAIDVIGTGRNGSTAAASGAQIANTSSKISSTMLGGAVPILQMLGGIIIIGSAAVHTIPKAHAEYSGAAQEFETARKSKDVKKIDQAKEGLMVAKLGLANQYLYGTMGAGLVSTGVVTMMSSDGASLMGFQPLVGTSAATAAGAALGAVYLIRGSVVMGRSLYPKDARKLGLLGPR